MTTTVNTDGATTVQLIVEDAEDTLARAVSLACERVNAAIDTATDDDAPTYDRAEAKVTIETERAFLLRAIPILRRG